jgi:hypothetical protein
MPKILQVNQHPMIRFTLIKPRSNPTDAKEEGKNHSKTQLATTLPCAKEVFTVSLNKTASNLQNHILQNLNGTPEHTG